MRDRALLIGGLSEDELEKIGKKLAALRICAMNIGDDAMNFPSRLMRNR